MSEPTILPSCIQMDAAVASDAPHTQVLSNIIRTTGDYTLSGECGYVFGIVLGAGDIETVDTATGAVASYGANTSIISNNRVRDFKFGGIGVLGDRSARVYDNKIRYIHENDPATCLLTPVLGVTNGLLFPCEPDVELPPDAEIIPFSVGIGVVGALADVRKNTVYSTFEPEFCYEFECPMSLGVGIGLLEPAPGSRARNNTITNTAFGFGLINDFFVETASALPQAPNGVQVTGNRVNESFVGLFVLGADNVFYGNRAHLNVLGVYVLDGLDNLFDSNDFRYNFEMDCIDESEGLGALGTANDWDGLNLGDPDYSFPEGLCGYPLF